MLANSKKTYDTRDEIRNDDRVLLLYLVFWILVLIFRVGNIHIHRRYISKFETGALLVDENIVQSHLAEPNVRRSVEGDSFPRYDRERATIAIVMRFRRRSECEAL